jgi:glycerol-3-phosphate dehydrogenase
LEEIFDIAVIGGGINGCGIARDAAGRGLSVYLAERDDLASGTSSASTKLIHGGLRYLEHYEFGLVREALKEREILWRMAPHIIHPLRFVLPHQKGLRPAWMIRMGMFLYDHLGKRELLPASRYLDLTSDETGVPLKREFVRGFEYSDCWVDDARLVILNAVDAAARGAGIVTRTRVVSARRLQGRWQMEVERFLTGERQTVQARAIVNASGPWISEVMTDRVGIESDTRTRLVKGSHIVVPRMFEHDKAYLFQNPDGRVVFAIPFEQDFTLIGTTDVDYRERPEEARADDDEIRYLCAAVSDYFAVQVSPQQVIWSYSGVRPLHGDEVTSAQEATRDYKLELDGSPDEAPILNIFGGKITTYRILAEEALEALLPWFPDMAKPWTGGSALPGGDFGVDGRAKVISMLSKRYPELPSKLVDRLTGAYGTLARDVLGDADDLSSLGKHFGADLYEREVTYMISREWAVTAEDILWRRSKLGLRLGLQERRELAEWLGHRPGVIGNADVN